MESTTWTDSGQSTRPATSRSRARLFSTPEERIPPRPRRRWQPPAQLLRIYTWWYVIRISCTSTQQTRRRWINAGLMLAQRRRRWANIDSTYCVCWARSYSAHILFRHFHTFFLRLCGLKLHATLCSVDYVTQPFSNGGIGRIPTKAL